MKKLFLLLPVIFLTGCLKSIPVKMDFPSVPEEMQQACPDLKQTQENETKLSKVIEVVVENYTQYHECKLKIDAWIEWHKQQKQISDSIK
jgi:N-dimethylarginine dimethylaminohydrolase